MTREYFDDLHELAESDLLKPFDVRHIHGDRNAFRTPRKRRLDTSELLFMFPDIYSGPNDGGLGVERVPEKYGVSPGTVSNYFRHVLFGLHKSLKSPDPQLTRWPNVEERKDIEGLMI